MLTPLQYWPICSQIESQIVGESMLDPSEFSKIGVAISGNHIHFSNTFSGWDVTSVQRNKTMKKT